MSRTATENRIPVACFAPTLTDQKLADYGALIREANESIIDARTYEALVTCYDCVCKWWELPTSKRADVTRWIIGVSTGAKGPKGEVIRKNVSVLETPLEDEHVSKLWDYVPWRDECELYGSLFDLIDPVAYKELRDCAFHLLWHCRELTFDREPMTQDLLSGVS